MMFASKKNGAKDPSYEAPPDAESGGATTDSHRNNATKTHAAGGPGAHALESTYNMLSTIVRDADITPEEALGPDLLEGERVARAFDVFYPEGRMAPWQFWLYTILSLGLFALYYHVAQWCYANKCCVPKTVELVRGRMALTTRGRLLVWKIHVVQEKVKVTWLSKVLCCLCKLGCKESCAPPVTYATDGESAAFVASQICDVELRSLATRSFLCGFCCCGETYESAVRVRLGTFRDDDAGGALAGDAAQRCAPVASLAAASYQQRVRQLFSGESGLGALLGRRPGARGAAVPFVDVVSCRESSTTRDYLHPGSADAFDELTEVHAALCAVALEGRAPTWTAPAGAGLVAPETSGRYEFGDLDIVSEERCAAPPNLAPLVAAAGERFLGCCANMYIVTAWDRVCFAFFVLSFPFTFPFGLPFFLNLRARRAARTGVVLTTHRLIEITAVRDDSCWAVLCPAFLLCCCPTARGVRVRSLLPGAIRNGVLERLSVSSVAANVLGDAGALRVRLDVDLGGLGHAMGGDKRLDKRLAFLKVLCGGGAARAAAPPLDGSAVGSARGAAAAAQLMRREESKDGDVEAPGAPELTGVEAKALPLLDGETVLARYQGKIHLDLGCLPGCCTNECVCYPGVALACCCGVQPLFASTEIIVTDRSVYGVNEVGNAPWCCLKACFKDERYQVFWAPLSDLASSRVRTVTVGNDNFCSRVCFGTAVGDCCCPRVKSVLDLSVGVNSIQDCLPIRCGDQNLVKAINRDANLAAYRAAAASVLSQLDRDHPIAATAVVVGAQPGK